MSLLIGLTGGIGSGKSAVANLFAEKGITHIDADVVARDVVAPNTIALAKIVEHFGEDILNTDGSLNRILLRKKIFDLPQERLWLEALLHPLIREDMLKQAQRSTSLYTLMVIPLLIENLPYPAINRILVVDAPKELQLQRILLRDQLSVEEAQKILTYQVSRETRLQHAHDVIINDNSLEHLRQQVEQLHQFYSKLSSHD